MGVFGLYRSVISGGRMASFQLQLFAAVVALAVGAAYAAPGDPGSAVSTLWICSKILCFLLFTFVFGHKFAH